MAVPAIQSGAFQSEAPPVNEPVRLRVWDLEDGRVSLYRIGDELHVKFSGADAEFRHQIGFEGNVDAMAEAFSNCSPLRIGRRIRFISAEMENVQFPSMVDPTVMITHRMWGVTLVSQMPNWNQAFFEELAQDESRLREICEESSLLAGHAYLLIESISPTGEYEARKAHIFFRRQDPAGYAIPYISAHVSISEDWPRTEVFLIRAHRISQLVGYVLTQIEEHRQAVEASNPWPIRFNDWSPVPSERIHNCLSWSIDALQRAGIHIPHGSSWYIPRRHIKEMEKICRQYVREGHNVDHAIPEESKQEIAEDKRKLFKLEKDLGGLAAVSAMCVVVPIAGWIALPAVLPMAAITGAVAGTIYHVRKKDLEKKQARHFVSFCKGE